MVGGWLLPLLPFCCCSPAAVEGVEYDWGFLLAHVGVWVGAWVGLGGMLVRLGLGRMEGDGRGPGAVRAGLVRRYGVLLDWGPRGWGPRGRGTITAAEERRASVLLWWAFDFDPEILLSAALKEKLDSRLGLIVKGSDVAGPSGVVWLCRLNIGILDLLA